MISKITRLNIGKYFIISCLASVIDFLIAYFLYKIMSINYLAASNVGIISGFVFQYFTSMKYIFRANGFVNSLVVYLATFLMGVLLANSTLWLSYEVLDLSFIISKALSMGVPFFITYFVRKRFLGVRTQGQG